METTWEVKRMFAKGAFGAVFMVSPSSSDTGGGNTNKEKASPIAVKVFSIANEQDAEQGKNEYVCLREFRAGRVQNSVHAFGCCLFDRLPPEFAIHVNGNSPYMAIAMPFVDGSTLLEYLTSHVTCAASPLPVPECISISSAIMSFITSGYAACGAVHGDLKPGNIMRNPTNKQLYVIDLTMGSCYSRPPVGWHQGTTIFMPPERLFFFDVPPSCASAWAGAMGDAWALGIIMATVFLTGVPLAGIPEYMAVLGPGRRFDPALTQSVYTLLWPKAAWYSDFSRRVQAETGMDAEITDHFFRLVLWRRAILLAPLESSPLIASSPNFQVLQRFAPEAIALYQKHGGRVYEITNDILMARMGPTFYPLYLATQSLNLAERCPIIIQETSGAKYTDTATVKQISTHIFSELIDGIAKRPCLVCGAPRPHAESPVCSTLCQNASQRLVKTT